MGKLVTLVVIIVVLVGAGWWYFSNNSQQNAVQPPPQPVEQAPATTTDQQAAAPVGQPAPITTATPATDTSDDAINNDLNAVDGQIKDFNTDAQTVNAAVTASAQGQ